MRTLKFREYVEYHPQRKNSPNYMKYDPTFIGDINETFNHNLESPGTKITYMQYTGLTDKNGKEIYEGDIIRWRNYSSFPTEDPFVIDIVEWSDKEACFITGMRYLKVTARRGEVIGNKFENPELLTKKVDYCDTEKI